MLGISYLQQDTSRYYIAMTNRYWFRLWVHMDYLFVNAPTSPRVVWGTFFKKKKYVEKYYRLIYYQINNYFI